MAGTVEASWSWLLDATMPVGRDARARVVVVPAPRDRRGVGVHAGLGLGIVTAHACARVWAKVATPAGGTGAPHGRPSWRPNSVMC